MVTEDEIVAALGCVREAGGDVGDVRAHARMLLACGHTICAWEDGQPVSFAIYQDDAAETLINLVWTSPTRRSRGYATSLLQQLIHKRPRPVSMKVHRRNISARRLCKKLGLSLEAESGEFECWAIGRRIAIMQPYCFPYIGYLQLIGASDIFVFYDDVNFIKRGRINRNSILVNRQAHTFSIPVSDASQNRLILETRPSNVASWRDAFLRTLEMAYKRAPFFAETSSLVAATLDSQPESIADLAITWLEKLDTYTRGNGRFLRSSRFAPESKGMEKSERLIYITRKLSGSRYINMPGGKKLYDKKRFLQDRICLDFLVPKVETYCQFGGSFIPALSSIDVLMFNSPEQVRRLIAGYGVE